MNIFYQALLLAAGQGTRLRPITLSTPKCLAPILGRPLLDYWLKLLSRGPLPSRVWVNTSYLKEQVEGFLQASQTAYPQLPITSTFEPNLLGTAGTLRALVPQFHPEQDVLLVHADNLSWFDLKAFLLAHKNRPPPSEITMMTFETDSPKTCGVVELDNKKVLQAFHEKVDHPPSKLANGAVYLISPEGLSRIKNMGPVSEFSTEVIPAFLGKIYCWHNTVYHRDIGSLFDYEVAQSDFQVIASQYQLK